MNGPKLSRRLTIFALLAPTLVGCATFAALYGGNTGILPIILLELDTALTLYEDQAIADTQDPADAITLQAIQTARKALILRIIERLVAGYPEIDASTYLERLNTATATAPDV